MKEPKLKVTLLGTGTSGGVPSLGCNCEVCRSHDAHDKRLRSAALVESDRARILIDAGPDLRQQLMPQPFQPLDAVLLTHVHYDHVGGIDDLRPYCKFGDINIYADLNTTDGLRHNMPYCFADHLYPGVPKLNLHTIFAHVPLTFGDIQVVPVTVMHDKLPILGYRFGNFAYITDMKTIADSELPYLKGVETLVVNALRFEIEHHSHQLVADAIAFSRKIGARRTYFTHMTHQMGLHEVASRRLPENFYLGYDGMVIEIE